MVDIYASPIKISYRRSMLTAVYMCFLTYASYKIQCRVNQDYDRFKNKSYLFSGPQHACSE